MAKRAASMGPLAPPFEGQDETTSEITLSAISDRKRFKSIGSDTEETFNLTKEEDEEEGLFAETEDKENVGEKTAVHKKVVRKLNPVIEAGSEDDTGQEVASTKKKYLPTLRAPGTLKDLRGFLDHARELNFPKPLDAFRHISNARLCGFFDRIIREDASATDGAEATSIPDSDISSIPRRYDTDLPEMTTCCKYDAGRYAIWRDDPKQQEILIVHINKEKHFPTIQVVGDRWEHLVWHLAKNDYNLIKDLLPSNKKVGKYRLHNEVRRAVKERNANKLGSCTGIGIRIPRKDNEPELAAPMELTRVVQQLGEDDPLFKVRAGEQLNEIYECVQLARNDGFFGMALELGQLLWLANYRHLHPKAKEYLVDAYKQLGREEYADIVTMHCERKEEEYRKREQKKERKSMPVGTSPYFTRSILRNA